MDFDFSEFIYDFIEKYENGDILPTDKILSYINIDINYDSNINPGTTAFVGESNFSVENNDKWNINMEFLDDHPNINSVIYTLETKNDYVYAHDLYDNINDYLSDIICTIDYFALTDYGYHSIYYNLYGSITILPKNSFVPVMQYDTESQNVELDILLKKKTG